MSDIPTSKESPPSQPAGMPGANALVYCRKEGEWFQGCGELKERDPSAAVGVGGYGNLYEERRRDIAERKELSQETPARRQQRPDAPQYDAALQSQQLRLREYEEQQYAAGLQKQQQKLLQYEPQQGQPQSQSSPQRRIGPFTQAEVESLPLVRGIQGPRGLSCTLCTEVLFAAGQGTGRRLPCSHMHHQICISRWLSGRDGRPSDRVDSSSQPSCPVCKAEVRA
mmetsp:Transcript_36111/g.93261  ORF Transcript_36111/g.93261 Transcript_36111/m.93261 type:complete len:225 (-) Transcript_36111:281-955(-)